MGESCCKVDDDNERHYQGTRPTGLNAGTNSQDIYAQGSGKYVASRSAEVKPETAA